jgi:CBS-domain-containing membrane protein
MRRTVKDVMTRTVAVVTADTPFKEIAQRLAEHRVAALPVVDARDRAIGIVSEADLLLKAEHPEERERRRLVSRRARHELERAAGLTAHDVMSSPPVTIGPEAPLGEAARVMHEGGFRSMPVVDGNGRVVGIVSRRDLLQAFLRPDDEIRREIAGEILEQGLWVDPGSVTVGVERGVVTLEGQVERTSMIPIIDRMVHGVEGVVHVTDRLSAEFDDSMIHSSFAAPWGVLPRGVG